MGVSVKAKQVQETAAKPKAAVTHTPKAKASQVVSEAQAMVDEAVQIHQRLEELEVPAMQKRLDEIKKHFSGIAKSMPFDEVAVFKGTKGEMEFTKASMEVEITDKPGLVKALGKDVFMEIAKVGVTDMKKYLAQNEIDQFTTKVPGSRRLASIRSTEKN